MRHKLIGTERTQLAVKRYDDQGMSGETRGVVSAWHGAAESSHNHPAALTGFKSKEFGGAGFNQLVMDDTDGQQRIQLKSTQHSSELNLGHLIHQADNYRGTGTELRTDAYGAPAGDMAAAMALLKQADTLAHSAAGPDRENQRAPMW